MSRHGYSDDWCDENDLINLKNYRGAVLSAIRGKRGQDFLQELLEAMAAHPRQALSSGELVGTDYVTCSHWGLYETVSACALGTVALKRGMDVSKLDPEDYHSVAAAFGIAESMAREIMFENDELGIWGRVSDKTRFEHMRKWVEHHLYERR